MGIMSQARTSYAGSPVRSVCESIAEKTVSGTRDSNDDEIDSNLRPTYVLNSDWAKLSVCWCHWVLDVIGRRGR